MPREVFALEVSQAIRPAQIPNGSSLDDQNSRLQQVEVFSAETSTPRSMHDAGTTGLLFLAIVRAARGGTLGEATVFPTWWAAEARMRLRQAPARLGWKLIYAQRADRIQCWSKFVSKAYWNVEREA